MSSISAVGGGELDGDAEEGSCVAREMEIELFLKAKERDKGFLRMQREGGVVFVIWIDGCCLLRERERICTEAI